MTAPFDFVQAPPQQPEVQNHPVEEAVALALAVWLASQVGLTGLRMPRALAQRVQALGVARAAISGMTALLAGIDLPPVGTGVVGRVTGLKEPVLLASYLLAALRRITHALSTKPGSRQQVLADALAAEKRYLDQQTAAAKKRKTLADQIDEWGAKGITTLRWKAKMDDRTTPDCVALNGTVFRIDNPPNGHYPGMEHVNCRCTSVPVRF